MARFARVVVPGLPHHVVHRGNRRSSVFFDPADRQTYRRWLREYGELYGMQVWAYCLMSNHVHIIATSLKPDSLHKAIGRTHMRFARWINRRHGWCGHLWSNRFYSAPLDDLYLWSVVKYVELNPVRAGMVTSAMDYPWSSARAHGRMKKDALLDRGRPFPGPIGDWAAWLDLGIDSELVKKIRQRTSRGRPCGSDVFIRQTELQLGRPLFPGRRGRRRRPEDKLSPKSV